MKLYYEMSLDLFGEGEKERALPQDGDIREMLEGIFREKRSFKQNERLTGFADGINALAGEFPNIDIEQEMQNPQFTALIRSGIEPSAAFKAVHHDEIVAAMMEYAANEIAENFSRLKNDKAERPQENSIAASQGVAIKTDVSALSRKQRAELAKRAAKGESIVL